MRLIVTRRRGHSQPFLFVVLVLLLHESIAEVLRDHSFDSSAIFAVQGVVFAVAVVVHVVGSHIATDLGFLIQSL